MSSRSKLICAMIFTLSATTDVTFAGLFSTISYNQSVFVTRNYPGETLSQSLIGTTLPVSQVVAVGDGGPSSRATYNFSDTGAIATFDVSVSASLTGIQQTAGEGTSSTLTYFKFSQPVTYKATLQDAVTPGLYCGASIGFDANGTEGVFSSPLIINTSYESDGYLSPGVIYTL